MAANGRKTGRSGNKRDMLPVAEDNHEVVLGLGREGVRLHHPVGGGCHAQRRRGGNKRLQDATFRTFMPCNEPRTSYNVQAHAFLVFGC